jgi:hypothetical protein
VLHTRRPQQHNVKNGSVPCSILLIAENTRLRNRHDLCHQQSCECAHIACDSAGEPQKAHAAACGGGPSSEVKRCVGGTNRNQY